RQGKDPGVAIRRLHFPRITAKAIDFATGRLRIGAGRPVLEDVWVSVTLNFARNPLAKDPREPYSYVVERLDVAKVTLNDRTVDGKPRVHQPRALDLRYDPAENSIATKVNLHSATIQSLAIDSPTLEITSAKDARAVQLDEVSADVKVTFAKEAQGDQPAVPMAVDIGAVHVGKLKAQGIVLQL